jgi:hypothetical protein
VWNEPQASCNLYYEDKNTESKYQILNSGEDCYFGAAELPVDKYGTIQIKTRRFVKEKVAAMVDVLFEADLDNDEIVAIRSPNELQPLIEDMYADFDQLDKKVSRSLVTAITNLDRQFNRAEGIDREEAIVIVVNLLFSVATEVQTALNPAANWSTRMA